MLVASGSVREGESEVGLSVVPIRQLERIKQLHTTGKKIRQIAREQARKQGRVREIVRSYAVPQYIEEVRRELIALGDQMLKSIRFALQRESDGERAYEILRHIGVMPPGAQEQVKSEPTAEAELWKQVWLARLDMAALERNAVYGTSLPPHLEKIASAKNSEEATPTLPKENSALKVEN
jgi:hypothetical protein